MIGLDGYGYGCGYPTAKSLARDTAQRFCNTGGRALTSNVRVDPETRAILVGWLHMIYHMQQPELYIPSRSARRGCRFC